jgi:hypothetical protein
MVLVRLKWVGIVLAPRATSVTIDTNHKKLGELMLFENVSAF